MTRVIIDAALRAKLHDLSEPLVLCDQHGRVFGHFVPAIDFSQWKAVSPGASEDELDRRAQSSERRYSTAEVLAHLRNIAQEETS